MYRADKKQTKRRLFIEFLLFVVPFLIVLALLIWLAFFRNSGSSSVSFVKTGSETASVEPKTTVFDNGLFKITLPATWQALGRKSPFSYETYYQFQNTQVNYKDQMLRIFVDIFPSDYAINFLLPVTVVNNHLVAGTMSDNCETFNGAPLADNGSQTASVNWVAQWQGISFTCDMINHQTVGTAIQADGYGVSLKSSNGTVHKYFFVYIDSNTEPNYQNITNVVNSFAVD
jgi:hypothetical protein